MKLEPKKLDPVEIRFLKRHLEIYLIESHHQLMLAAEVAEAIGPFRPSIKSALGSIESALREEGLDVPTR